MADYRRKEEVKPVRKKPSQVDPLTLAVRLASENGLTYRQLQHLESHGKAKIKDGKLLFKGRDY